MTDKEKLKIIEAKGFSIVRVSKTHYSAEKSPYEVLTGGFTRSECIHFAYASIAMFNSSASYYR